MIEQIDRVYTKNQIPGLRRHVKVADHLFPVFFVLFQKPADGLDLCCQVRTVTDVHQEQSKVGTTLHGFICAPKQDHERVGGWLASFQR